MWTWLSLRLVSVQNTALADGKIELFRNGAFLVDKKQETSLPGVFAVGDCATVYDNARKDTSYIALASNAVRTGIVGAYNACGHELEESVFKVQTVSQSMVFTWFQLVDS